MSAATIPGTRLRALCIGLLLAVTVAAYLPTFSNGFSEYDDQLYLYENPHVTSGLSWENVRWAFTDFHASNWHPMTWLSHMADVEMVGVAPGPHHALNLAWHLLNTLLVCLVLARYTRSFWVGLASAGLFALHPMHVESVAWIAERKDTLSCFFLLASLWCWHGYAAGRRKVSAYLAALALFALGLMAKPMLVTLPCILLLLDVWPLGRVPSGPLQVNTPSDFPVRSWGRLVAEKIPFFLFAAASCVITPLAQKSGGALSTLGHVGPLLRVANALAAYLSYLGKFFVPVNMAVFYPFPLEPPVFAAVAGGVVLVAVTALCWALRRRAPYLLVGWLWFVGTLVPVIGLVQVGAQGMADRYTYIPYIGLGLALFPAMGALAGTTYEGRRGLWIFGLCAVAVSVVFTNFQTRTWESQYTLFRHAMEVVPNNHVALNNVGLVLFNRGDEESRKQALALFQKAHDLRPDFREATYNVGSALMHQKRYNEALPYFLDVIRLDDTDVLALNAAGDVLAWQERFDKAVGMYERVLELEPDNEAARNGLDLVRPAMKRRAQAESTLEVARRAARENRLEDAAALAARCVEQDPHYAEGYYVLGVALANQRQPLPALVNLVAALNRDDGRDAGGIRARIGKALDAVGELLTSKGDVEGMLRGAWLLSTVKNKYFRHGELALKLTRLAEAATGGESAALLDVRATALAEMGQYETAVDLADQALFQARAGGQGFLLERLEAHRAAFARGEPWREDVH